MISIAAKKMAEIVKMTSYDNKAVIASDDAAIEDDYSKAVRTYTFSDGSQIVEKEGGDFSI